MSQRNMSPQDSKRRIGWDKFRMLTPKQRDEMFIAELGARLNEHGFWFKISKTRLSWKNKDVSLTVTTRGNKYSTAECSLRWVRVQIYSNHLKKLHQQGAPVDGLRMNGPPNIIFDRDVTNPDESTSISLRFTERESIVQAAKQVAPCFSAFWEDTISNWIDHSKTIEFLSSSDSDKSTAALFQPDTPPTGSPELDQLIQKLIAKNTSAQTIILGELLLATNRHDDLRKLAQYGTAYAKSDRPRAQWATTHSNLIQWLDAL